MGDAALRACHRTVRRSRLPRPRNARLPHPQSISPTMTEFAGCTIYIATSNPGKLRDFSAAALEYGVEVRPLPGFDALPQAEEDAITFEENARTKAQQYSLALPGEIVIADDSGLEVEALANAPGVLSARYAAM